MEFLFSDKVKVVDGFYQGLHGIVTDYDKLTKTYFFESYGTPVDKICRQVKTWIYENNLKKDE